MRGPSTQASSKHFVTIVVCTYNRVSSLRSTLAALESLRGDGFDQEWIVVDNNSTDGTARLLIEYAAKNPRLRPLSEPRQGKSHALNTAIAVAKGDIVAFTDDDVLPAHDWLLRALEVYDRFGADAGAVGGRVLLEKGLHAPHWLHRELIPFLGLKDFGEQISVVQPPEGLVGANMSVRRDVLAQIGGFNTSLGPRGHDYGVAYSEDYELCYRVARMEGAGKVLYTPHMVAYHTMLPGKLTRRYFLRRALGEGKARARLGPQGTTGGLLGATAQFVYYLIRLPLAWLLHVREPDERFLREFKLVREWGALAERWRMAMKRRRGSR